MASEMQAQRDAAAKFTERLKEASKPGSLDFGSWRSIQAGPEGAGGKKAWLQEGMSTHEQINGWLACMGVGSRSATIVTPEGIEAQKNGEIEDARYHHTSVHYSHGPYLDDWSRVPAEVACKYNTSPTYSGDFPANQPWSYGKS